MVVLEKRLEEIKPYEKNPRRNDDAVQSVANSIKEFGFKVPIIIDKDNVIVAGHTRYKAAEKLGLETVPCVVANDLTPKQLKAFRIADNKTSELSSWNFTKLAEEVLDLDNIADFGFTISEIDRLEGLANDLMTAEDDIYEADSFESPSQNFYEPVIPTESKKEVKQEDIEKAEVKIQKSLMPEHIKRTIMICPYCGKEFTVD